MAQIDMDEYLVKVVFLQFTGYRIIYDIIYVRVSVAATSNDVMMHDYIYHTVPSKKKRGTDAKEII